ncbi:[protein-PII] uridylyltransferase [Actinoallomurus iriomotensis]|uniref:Bifunctional uridylyltransferase/uridylyl-removing enzyme n=1 Tax=Actinoallomurus iriomotensis TaxID=478107 RepID=A0A9W6VYA6_9ACTN|nr:[protein-PII] uridylyltransferase [Actinoallomurus iriomotensis]GLY84114.1 bifunctional uridylyltransferase/uridylyl-removing enzyme [Actinoallomurus iriomotensis]
MTDTLGGRHGPAEATTQPGPAAQGGDGARARLRAERARRAGELDRRLARLVGAEPDVALVAVGSHGREELTPGGDVDLVLLHRDRPDVAALADRVWYPIWDSGLRLDHSVRTPAQARAVAREDLKAVLGLISARHVAGDPDLTREVRETVLADWRSDARRRLPELREMTRARWRDSGELAFLLEPDLKESRGGLRDVHAIQAVAAAWIAPAPSARVKDAYALLLDVRHALHETTGRAADRLVLQEQGAVAEALGLLDAEVLLRMVVEAARTVTFAVDHMWRAVDRFCSPSGRPVRRPLADGVVEHDSEVVLARGADPRDPTLVLRAAAAAAQAGLPLAISTVERLARETSPMPVPWPAEARDALVTLLGAGSPAIGVWEALDQVGLIERLLPDWERVRNRPQRNPVHTFTVDRHLVETATRAAAHTRDVARPDLLLVGALLHDIGKGWPGDHSKTGAVMARDLGERLGFADGDVRVLEAVVRHHLLLPETATRRDLDDPMTIETVAETVGDSVVLETLAALAVADGQATGPAAWGPWKAGLVAELTRRVAAVLAGAPPPVAPDPTPEQLALARHGGGSVRVVGSRITVVAPDRPGLLWQAAGVLALHRLAVRGARTVSWGQGAEGPTALLEFMAVPEYGSGPDPAALEVDLRRVLAGRLDVEKRLERRARSYRPRKGVPVPPPRVTMIDDASATATVVEVRAHDRPGLLWRVGHVLGSFGLQVRAARVETLGAEAVDVFYVVDAEGRPVTDERLRASIRAGVLDAVR